MLKRRPSRKASYPVRRPHFFQRARSGTDSSAISGRSDATSDDVRASVLAVAGESLPCLDIAPRAAAPEAGLTTVLSVASNGRADVLDLDRAFLMGEGGSADVSWLSLPPDRDGEPFRLLLDVSVKLPVQCRFAVRISIPLHDLATHRQVAYLLAADKLALTFDLPVTADSAIVLEAPADRRALSSALDANRA
jgi:hypothetical protein